jgi:hypothetical protein
LHLQEKYVNSEEHQKKSKKTRRDAYSAYIYPFMSSCPIQLVRQSQHFKFLIAPTVMEKKQRTHNFCWSIPGKKGGRNIARTRPPNGGGIVPPVLSAGQGGHFTPGGRGGGGHRLVLRVRIHREGVQEPHGSQAASTTSFYTPYFAYETFSWSSKTATISSTPAPVLVIS